LFHSLKLFEFNFGVRILGSSKYAQRIKKNEVLLNWIQKLILFVVTSEIFNYMPHITTQKSTSADVKEQEKTKIAA